MLPRLPASVRRPMAAPLAAVLALALALPAVRAGATIPQSFDERRAEIAALDAEYEAAEKGVGPLANAAIALVPEYVRQLRAIHQVPLDEAERKALIEQGAGALAPEKSAVFEAASPSFQAMKQALGRYFEAYDTYMQAEVRRRTFGAVLKALERRAALEEHLSGKQRAKLDAQFETMRGYEETYRGMLADPEAKHYRIHSIGKDLYFGADGLDDLLLRYERKYGLADKEPWGHRIGNFFRSIKRKARVLKINALALPAAARMFTHVFLRPFWNKEHDADKTNELIRFYSKSYRWAAGMKLDVRGAEGIPTDAPVVFALSHRATIEDAMTMTAVVPGTYSFMWAATAMPGWLKKKLVADPTVIAVGGQNPDGTKVDAVAESIRAIQEGRNLALFPEGNVPTPAKETRPLRAGLDVVTAEVSEKPVYIVPITIDDTAVGYDAESHKPSETGKMNITVEIGRPIDPLRLKSVPGADRQLLLDTVRGIFHRNLYRADVPLSPPACETVCETETLGVIPPPAANKFQQLHAAP